MTMVRVALSGLRSSHRNWLGVLIVVFVAAGFLSMAIAGSQTASQAPGDTGDMLRSFTTPSAALTILSAVFTVNSVSVLAVVGQRRNHALWQVLGFLPGQVSLMACIQILCVTLIGSISGTAVGAVAAQPAFEVVYAINSAYAAPAILFTASTWIWTSLFMLAAVSLGGLHAACKAGWAPLIEAVGRTPERIPKFGKVRWVFLLLAAAGTTTVGFFLANPASKVLGEAIEVMVPLGILFACLLTITLSLASPIVFPILLRTWTSALPARISTTWYLARTTSRARVAQSTSAITPLMIPTALSASLFTVFMMAKSAQTAAGLIADSSSTINTPSIFTVLVAPLAISAVAVTVVVYMTSRERERENALILANGGTSTTIIISAAFEGIIYVATAAIVGLLIATALGAVMLAGLLPIVPDTRLRVGIEYAMGTLAVGLLLVETAVIGPSLSAIRLNVARVLSAE